jgi:hypothetical protein
MSPAVLASVIDLKEVYVKPNLHFDSWQDSSSSRLQVLLEVCNLFHTVAIAGSRCIVIAVSGCSRDRDPHVSKNGIAGFDSLPGS